jgi:hypothetical protein
VHHERIIASRERKKEVKVREINSKDPKFEELNENIILCTIPNEQT